MRWPNASQTITDLVGVPANRFLTAPEVADAPACGEASCAPVAQAYISHFTGPDCTGEEHYYTGCNGFDGIRRSWDGGQVVGTTLRTATVYSWRYSLDGQCRDDWQSGLVLSDFARVYRPEP